MAALVGIDGNFAVTTGAADDLTAEGFMSRWRARFQVITSDVTPFSEAQHTIGKGGLLRIDGSASGAFDDTATTGSPTGNNTTTRVGVQGLQVEMLLTVGTSKTYAFSGLINNFGFDVNKTGDAVITYDFVGGNGGTAFTETWT